MVSEIKLWTKEFFINIRCNILWTIGYFICTAGFILLHVRSSAIARKLPSLADAFITTSTYWFFGIELGLVTIFLLTQFVKDDFKCNLVLRGKSRKLLWLKQIYKCILFSVFTSIWITICTYFLGGLMTRRYINWGKESSLYFLSNQVTNPSIKISNVIILFFISSCIRILVMSIIYILLYWITNKRVIGWIIIIALEFAEVNIPVLCRIISIEYYVWISPIRMTLGFLYGIALVIIATVVGIATGRRKEFYYG